MINIVTVQTCRLQQDELNRVLIFIGSNHVSQFLTVKLFNPNDRTIFLFITFYIVT